MRLNQVYQPIKKELNRVEKTLKDCLKNTRYKSILEITDYLLDAKGKRLRPALVILCAKAASNSQVLTLNSGLIKIATAIELIHIASLIHDDVIDHAPLRHNKSTINHKWGSEVSIALGDYLYSLAFQLISHCGNTDVLGCVSSATKVMCEGELVQVCERDNLDLLRQRYMVMVKKKTASLFAASCQAGALISNISTTLGKTLRDYGLNLGIAFQIVDDCLDLIGQEKDLGKSPGADFRMGEITLPLLNLSLQSKDKDEIISLIRRKHSHETFNKLRLRFINSIAFTKTKEEISTYIHKAKKNLDRLDDSHFKDSLFALADYVASKVKL